MATPLVLVVDDNLDQVEKLRTALEGSGYRVEAARSATAMAVAKRLQPAMILLDLSLPGTNGKKACIRLRANAATKAIPVVGVSTSRPEEYTDIPVSGWLPKPYSLEELDATVARWTTVT